MAPPENFNDDHPPPQPWNWQKFNLTQSDLTTLSTQYNTTTIPIQSPAAFHHDVASAAHAAHSLRDFHVLLSHLRGQRLAELREAWGAVALDVVCRPADFGGTHPGRWRAFRWLAACRSLDAVVLFFAELLLPRSGGGGARETPMPPTPESRPSPAPARRPAAARREASPTLGRGGGVGKRGKAKPRPKWRTAAAEGLGKRGVQTPPATPRRQQQHPAPRTKGKREEGEGRATRVSRRLAGEPPEIVEGRSGGR